MSCTVFAVPYAIAWLVGSMASVYGMTAAASAQYEREDAALADDLESIANENSQTMSNENFADPLYGQNPNNCENFVITDKHFLEKSLETPFTDKDILIKTLKEHGVSNLTENEYGKIECTSGDYKLSFEKPVGSQTYYTLITYNSNDDGAEKMNDLTSEYAINVQEQSYNHIIEKLSENNMQIESEEISEDNTIVLTVNLE